MRAVGTRTGYSSGTFCWADRATPDVEAGKAFYGGLFGWDFEHLSSPDAPDYVVCVREGARVAALHEASDQPPHWNNYVTAEDPDATAARAAELGGGVLAGPFDVLDSGRMAAITDPQGAMLVAWKPARHFGAEVVNEIGAMTWNDLITSDVDGAQAFYSALFGWTFEDVTDGQGRYFSITGPDGDNGGMMPRATEQMPPFWQPYFAVASLEDAAERIRALGGTPVADPMPVPGGGFIPVLDPHGAGFSLFSGHLDP